MPEVPAPSRERGYAHDPLPSSSWLLDDLTRETTPELVWPLSVEVYDRMDRTDPQVSSTMRAVTSPIIRTTWRLDGDGCRPEVVEHCARNLGVPIKGTGDDDLAADKVPLRGQDRFRWKAHLPDALLSLKYGHSYCEQVYWFDDAGRAHIRKVALRPARTLKRVNVARDGGLDSIEQKAAGSAYGLRPWNAGGTLIPVWRLVAYVNEREGANWLGKSLLRSAYKMWIFKDRDLRTMTTANRRNGMGIPVMTAPAGKDTLTKEEQLVRRVAAGDDAGIAQANGGEFDLVGVKGSTANVLESIKYYDEQIARAVLAHFLNLGSQTGSWALGSTFADFFTLSLGAIADDIRDTANQYLVTDLVAANWGSEEPVPQLVYDEIGARQSELDHIRQLAGLTDDQALAAWIRQQLTNNAVQGGAA